MLVPFVASAKGITVSTTAAVSGEISTDRGQIRSTALQIVTAKLKIRGDVKAISVDIAGAKLDPNITSGADYQSVVKNLAQIKSLVQQANAIDYKSELTGVKGGGSTQTSSTLQDVIGKMNDKLALLNQALTLADSTKATADTIRTQKKTDIAAWQSFHTQAMAKKQTIDTTRAQIDGLITANNTIVAQISAAFSANQALLASDPSGVQKVTQELQTVKTQLNTEFNGKVVKAHQAYNGYVKSQDYTDALAQLDDIISIQANRITVLNTAQTELTQAQNDLNAIVASASSAPVSSSGTI
jgi:chromosome segregation ATPase